MACIKDLEAEIVELRAKLIEKEELLASLKKSAAIEKCGSKSHNRLLNKEISRYSRQIILPEIGVKGQLALKKSSVLIVGAGGLGKYFYN